MTVLENDVLDVDITSNDERDLSLSLLNGGLITSWL